MALNRQGFSRKNLLILDQLADSFKKRNKRS